MCKKLVHHKYFKILEGRGFLSLQPGARYPCSWLKLNCPALPWKELLKKHFRQFGPVDWPAIVIVYMSEERFLYRTGVIRGQFLCQGHALCKNNVAGQVIIYYSRSMAAWVNKILSPQKEIKDPRGREGNEKGQEKEKGKDKEKKRGKKKGEIREGKNERKTGKGNSRKKGRVGKGKLGRGNGWKWIVRDGDRQGLGDIQEKGKVGTGKGGGKGED